MNRKKWTPISDPNDELLQSREKRKWQIAFRRYVLEANKSSHYAPYFGLDQHKMRQWIEMQFDQELNWDNFSDAWQFEHIIPVAYFNFRHDDDLRLCWNFINIRVDKLKRGEKEDQPIDVIAAKHHFLRLHQLTAFPLCLAMVHKIELIEASQAAMTIQHANFITANQSYLTAVQDFTSHDFDRLNTGTELQSLLYEKEFLKKIGT